MSNSFGGARRGEFLDLLGRRCPARRAAARDRRLCGSRARSARLSDRPASRDGRRPRRSRCRLRARRARSNGCRADNRRRLPPRLRQYGPKSTIVDAARAQGPEIGVIFGSASVVLRPIRQVVLIDGRSIGRQKRRGSGCRAARVRRASRRAARPSRRGAASRMTSPGALPHRLLAQIEHAPVAPDEDRVVARAKHRLGQILVGADHRAAHAEMILEIGVESGRQRRASPRASAENAAQARAAVPRASPLPGCRDG